MKLNGLWYEVELRPLPTMEEQQTSQAKQFLQFPAGEPADVVLKLRAFMLAGDSRRADPFRAAWGGNVYAATKRQVSGEELRRAGLRKRS